MKQPYIPFFTGDWLKDPLLRSVSPAARGLWIDLLCIMWESPKRGYLCYPNGKAYSADVLSRMTGVCIDFVYTLLEELENAGVFSKTDECVIFSRRMTKTNDISEKRANSAKKRWGENAKPIQNACKPDTNTHAKTMQTHENEIERVVKEVKEVKEVEGGAGGNNAGRYSAEFLEFWQAYPRRVGKGDAWRAWEKSRKAKILPALETILSAVEAAQESEQWQRDGGQYIPHPATWLNRRGWEDEEITEDQEPIPRKTAQIVEDNFDPFAADYPEAHAALRGDLKPDHPTPASLVEKKNKTPPRGYIAGIEAVLKGGGIGNGNNPQETARNGETSPGDDEDALGF